MAVSHTYTITKLQQLNDGSGIVHTVHYEITSTDDVTTTSVTRRAKCELPAPAEGEEVPYLSLTRGLVIGWVQTHSKLPPTADLESDNEDRIARIDTPPTAPTMVDSLPF